MPVPYSTSVKNEEKLSLLMQLVEEALNELYKKDHYLLEQEVHERSIVFKFAHYLQILLDEDEEFLEYDLDVEYNRNGNSPKIIPGRRNGAEPDVIIHKRGSNMHNLLMIEFKTHWNSETKDDLKKLKEFTRNSGIYKYSLGLSIVLGKEPNTVEIISVRNGEINL